MLTRTHRFLPTSLTFFTGALSCVVTVSRVRAVLQELDLIAGPQPLSDCEQNTAISTNRDANRCTAVCNRNDRSLRGFGARRSRHRRRVQ